MVSSSMPPGGMEGAARVHTCTTVTRTPQGKFATTNPSLAGDAKDAQVLPHTLAKSSSGLPWDGGSIFPQQGANISLSTSNSLYLSLQAICLQYFLSGLQSR